MFATTGALAPQRSAERKVRLRKGEGVGTNTQAKVSNSSGLTATYVLDKNGK